MPLLCLLLSSTALFFSLQDSKTAYVDVAKVYQSFKYQKQLEQQLRQHDQQAQFLIDSMEMQMQSFAQLVNQKPNDQNREQLTELQRQYSWQRQELIEEQEKLAVEFDEQIWKQLNQYLQDYADEEGYDYIIGARGDGTIIGGSPAYNLTPQIINYVNQRYDGKME